MAEERRRRGFGEGDEGRTKGYGKDELRVRVCEVIGVLWQGRIYIIRGALSFVAISGGIL